MLILQKRYKIAQPLGRGGLGSVFLCDDLRLVGQQWAIKKMNQPDVELQEAFRETFDREARTLATLRHPNLPLIVDYFEENGDCYLVTEYVQGENLAEYVRDHGPLSERQALEHGLVLIGVLAFLHGHTPPIIFRDLKPENVMLTAEGSLKLVDFGLARRFQAGKQRDTVPSGSVGYSPPEQWEDRSQTDARSDIYAWGATMVFLVTGKVPSPVFPMSALQEIPLSEGARALLTRALKARPSERFLNAEELSDALRRHLTGEEPLPPAPVEPSADAGQVAERAALLHSALVSVLDEEASADLPPPTPTAPVRAPTFSLPLVLLLLATIALLGAFASQFGSSAIPPAHAGVAPYHLRFQQDEKMEEGRRYYQQNRLPEAMAALDQATALHPDDAMAHLLKENAAVRLSGTPLLLLPFIGSLTGVDAAEGYAQLHGLALAQAQLNAAGGIDGRRLVVDLYDDESSTSRCLQIAEGLVADQSLMVVMGAYNSQRTTALAPLFNAARLPLVAAVASSQRVWECGPYVYSAADSTDRRVRALAAHLAGHSGYKKIGLVIDQTSHLSAEMARTFDLSIQSAPLELIKLPPYDGNQSDFSGQTDAIQKAQPDCVMLCDYRAEVMGRFAVQMRARGLQATLCAQCVPFSQELVELGGSSVNGLILSGYFHPDMAPAFTADFTHKFGNLTPTHVAVVTYDAVRALAQALRQCKNRQQLADFLRATGSTRPAFDGVAGRFALGRRLDIRPVWLIEVRDGRYHLLEKAPEEILSNRLQ